MPASTTAGVGFSFTVGLSILVLAATGARADSAPATPGTSPPPGMKLFKTLPLTGHVSGIVHIQCTDSAHCSIRRATAQLGGTGGTLEVWQDARISAALRSRLWGQRGGPIEFAGVPARNALLILRDSSGAAVAQSMTETPLVDLDALFLGAATPTFLISIDYRTPQADLISRGILQVDAGTPSLGYATFSGPSSVPVAQPDGVTATVAVPGPASVIAVQDNFELRADPGAHSARLTVTGCYPSSYVNYRTRAKVNSVLTLHADYELHGGTWTRSARLMYDNCGGRYAPGQGRLIDSQGMPQPDR